MPTSDLVLLAYIFLIVPAMVVGFIFARRKMFEPYHKLTMTGITLLNWALIFFVMLVTYRRDVAPQIPQNLSLPGVLIPTIHLLPGLIAQLLATYLVIRMWFENQLPEWFKVKNIKLYMRTTLGLWLLTALLGVLTWAVINKGFLSAAAPISTQQAGSNVVQLLSGNRMEPVEISVTTGTTVQFINADTKKHTVTADDGSFDSGDMKPGATFSFTFNTPGDVAYYCQFHGDKGHVGMAAIVHVTGNAINSATTATAAPPTPNAAVSPAVATSAATNAAANVGTSVVNVALNDDMFSTQSLTVTVGTTVHWQNTGKHKHTVTADDGSFDSGQLKPGDVFDHMFTAVGDVPVYCMNHGDKGGVDMAMVVHVVAAQSGSGGGANATEAASVATLAPTVTTLAVPKELGLLLVSADDTPHNTPYVAGLQSQNAIIKAQSAQIADALKQGHYEDAQAAAEAILNVIEGGAGKDRDADGKVNQPGDTFGLKQYIFSINENADTLKTGATEPIKTAAAQIESTGQNSLKDLNTIAQQAQALLDAKSLVDAQKVVPTLTDAVTALDADTSKMVSIAAALNVPNSRVTPTAP